MVFVVFTRAGYDEVESCIAQSGASVWVNGDVLSDQEIMATCGSGITISTFSGMLDPNDDVAIQNAIAVIAEHHPGERLWVEFQSPSTQL